DFGRPLWFDLFLLPQAFRVLRGKEPLLVLPIGTSKDPNEPLLVVPAGTVWIRGNQLTSGVPANAWVGMRVKGGTIRIPKGSTLTDNELPTHVAALPNLRIELDPPALAGPASGPAARQPTRKPPFPRRPHSPLAHSV